MEVRCISAVFAVAYSVVGCNVGDYLMSGGGSGLGGLWNFFQCFRARGRAVVASTAKG